MSMPKIGVLLASLWLVVTLSGCAGSDTRESTGRYIDSAATTARVKSALARDDLTSLLQIEVETFRGTVQLSGFVDSAEQRERAGAIAESVQGVRAVENALLVKPAS